VFGNHDHVPTKEYGGVVEPSLTTAKSGDVHDDTGIVTVVLAHVHRTVPTVHVHNTVAATNVGFASYTLIGVDAGKRASQIF
jgi:hypothetical protein